MLNILVILGSTRQNRSGEQVFQWVQSQLKDTDTVHYEYVDLRDVDLPFFNEVASVAYLNGAYSTPAGAAWAQKVKEADGYIVLATEYNHGYTAVLKNALDYAYTEWNKKPIGFVGYGAAVGGARAVEQLRLVAIELQMAPVRNAVHMVNVWSAFDQNGQVIDASYNKQMETMNNDVIWWGTVLKEGREKTK